MADPVKLSNPPTKITPDKVKTFTEPQINAPPPKFVSFKPLTEDVKKANKAPFMPSGFKPLTSNLPQAASITDWYPGFASTLIANQKQSFTLKQKFAELEKKRTSLLKSPGVLQSWFSSQSLILDKNANDIVTNALMTAGTEAEATYKAELALITTELDKVNWRIAWMKSLPTLIQFADHIEETTGNKMQSVEDLMLFAEGGFLTDPMYDELKRSAVKAMDSITEADIQWLQDTFDNLTKAVPKYASSTKTIKSKTEYFISKMNITDKGVAGSAYGMTAQELLSSFKNEPVPGLTSAEITEFKDVLAKYANGEETFELIDAAEQAIGSFFNDWINVSAEVHIRKDTVFNGIPMDTTLTLGETAKMAFMSPMLFVSELLEPWNKYVADPWTSTLVQKLSPAVSGDNLRALTAEYMYYGMSYWEASALAYNNVEMNPVVKMLTSAVTDPLNLVGTGIVPKSLAVVANLTSKASKLEKVSSAVVTTAKGIARFEKSFNAFFDAPFKYALAKSKSFLGHTPTAAAKIASEEFSLRLNSIVTSSGSSNLTTATADQLRTIVQQSLDIYKDVKTSFDYKWTSIKGSQARFGIARDLLSSRYLSDDELMAIIKAVSPSFRPDKLTDDLRVSINQMIDAYIAKALPEQQIANFIRSIAGDTDSTIDGVIKAMSTIVSKRADDIKAGLKSSKASSIQDSLLSNIHNSTLSRHKSKLHARINRSNRAVSWLSSQTDRLIYKGVINTISRKINSPMATQYLLFGALGPLNYLENILRNATGGMELFYPRGQHSILDEVVDGLFYGIANQEYDLVLALRGQRTRLDITFTDPNTGNIYSAASSGSIYGITKDFPFGPTIEAQGVRYKLGSFKSWNDIVSEFTTAQRSWNQAQHYLLALRELDPEGMRMIDTTILTARPKVANISFLTKSDIEVLERQLHGYISSGQLQKVLDLIPPVLEVQNQVNAKVARKYLNACDGIPEPVKATMIDTIRSGKAMKNIDQFKTDSLASIMDWQFFNLKATEQALDDLTKHITAAGIPKNVDELATQFEFLSEMAQAIEGRMSDSYTVQLKRANMLRPSAKDKYYADTSDILHSWVDKAKAAMDSSVQISADNASRMKLTPDQLAVIRRHSNIIDDFSNAALDFRTADAKIKKTIEDTPRKQRDNQFWNSINSQRDELYKDFRKEWSKTRKQMFNSYNDLRTSLGLKTNRVGNVIVEGDLTPYHIASLFRVNTADLPQTLTQVDMITKVRPRQDWVDWVRTQAELLAQQQNVTADSLGFTEKAIGDCYDQMWRSFGIEPDNDILGIASKQIDGLKSELLDNPQAKVNPDSYKMYQDYLTDIYYKASRLPMYRDMSKVNAINFVDKLGKGGVVPLEMKLAMQDILDVFPDDTADYVKTVNYNTQAHRDYFGLEGDQINFPGGFEDSADRSINIFGTSVEPRTLSHEIMHARVMRDIDNSNYKLINDWVKLLKNKDISPFNDEFFNDWANRVKRTGSDIDKKFIAEQEAAGTLKGRLHYSKYREEHELLSKITESIVNDNPRELAANISHYNLDPVKTNNFIKKYFPKKLSQPGFGQGSIENQHILSSINQLVTGMGEKHNPGSILYRQVLTDGPQPNYLPNLAGNLLNDGRPLTKSFTSINKALVMFYDTITWGNQNFYNATLVDWQKQAIALIRKADFNSMTAAEKGLIKDFADQFLQDAIEADVRTLTGDLVYRSPAFDGIVQFASSFSSGDSAKIADSLEKMSNKLETFYKTYSAPQYNYGTQTLKFGQGRMPSGESMVGDRIAVAADNPQVPVTDFTQPTTIAGEPSVKEFSSTIPFAKNEQDFNALLEYIDYMLQNNVVADSHLTSMLAREAKLVRLALHRYSKLSLEKIEEYLQTYTALAAPRNRMTGRLTATQTSKLHSMTREIESYLSRLKADATMEYNKIAIPSSYKPSPEIPANIHQPTITDQWQATREQAMLTARSNHELDYPSYSTDDSTFIDEAMKTIFPFWTYEKFRYTWLPRTMLRRPALATAVDRYMDDSPNGDGYYSVTPDIQVNMLNGSVFGPMARMYKANYPGFYDKFPGNNVLDLIQRLGFYPGAAFSFPLAIFGSSAGPQVSDAFPAWLSTGVSALRAVAPTSVDKLINDILPERFLNYLTMVRLASEGQMANQLYQKLLADKLTPEETKLWFSAQSKVSAWSILSEQTGIFRWKPHEYTQLLQHQAEAIYEMTGVDIATQKQIAQMYPYTGKRFSDYFPLDSLQQKFLYENEVFKYFAGVTAPLLPAKQAAQQQAITNYYNEVDELYNTIRYQGNDQQDSIVDLNEAFIKGLTGAVGGITPSQWRAGVSSAKSYMFISSQALGNSNVYKDVPKTLEERIAYYQEKGEPVPTFSPDQEILNVYYSLQPEEKVNPETGLKELDFDTYFQRIEWMLDLLDPNYRQRLLDRIQYSWTPLEKLYWKVNKEQLRPYSNIRNVVYDSLSKDEQTVIDRYTSGIPDPERSELLAVERPDGTKLISWFNSQVSSLRKQLRVTDPELDAWLVFFGTTDIVLTDRAKEVLSQLKSTYATEEMIGAR